MSHDCHRSRHHHDQRHEHVAGAVFSWVLKSDTSPGVWLGESVEDMTGWTPVLQLVRAETGKAAYRIDGRYLSTIAPYTVVFEASGAETEKWRSGAYTLRLGQIMPDGRLSFPPKPALQINEGCSDFILEVVR